MARRRRMLCFPWPAGREPQPHTWLTWPTMGFSLRCGKITIWYLWTSGERATRTLLTAMWATILKIWRPTLGTFSPLIRYVHAGKDCRERRTCGCIPLRLPWTIWMRCEHRWDTTRLTCWEFL